MRTDPLPRVGDRVFYFAYGTPGGEFSAGVSRAAIVTELVGNQLRLCIFNPSGLFFSGPLSRRGPLLTAGCWDWDDRGIESSSPHMATSIAASEIPHLCARCLRRILPPDVFYTSIDGLVCHACTRPGEEDDACKDT